MKTSNTPDTQSDWLFSFDLGYNASDRWNEAQTFEKGLEPDSPQAEAYTLGRETYEQDREKETLEELRTMRQDTQERDNDMEMDREC